MLKSFVHPVLAMVVCAGSLAAALQGSLCDPFPAGSTTFLARNRAAFQASGGQVSPSQPELGTFLVDALDKAMSMRFTSPHTKTISSVWIYSLVAKGPPGLVRLSLQADQGGRPTGVPLAAATVVPQTGWQQVSVPAVAISACGIYHVVIEPWTAPFDDTHFVRYVAMVTRSPIPWQPFDAASEGASSFYDPELALLFDDGSGEFVWQWDTVHMMYVPIFMLQATDLSTIGQPYNVHLEQLFVMEMEWGQSFLLPGTGTVDVNYVALFTERFRQDMSQTDSSLVYLYDPVAGTPITNAVLLQPPQSIFNRAHWFGAVFPGGVTLNRGQEYYAVLRSDNIGSSVLGFWLSMERTTAPLGLGVQDPTYGAILRGAVYSADGGQTFNKPLGGRTDAGFMLANLAEPNGPMAVHDESALYKFGTSQPARIVGPSTPIDINIVLRNIGGGQGNLVVDVINPFTLQTVLTGGPRILPNVDANKDVNAGSITLTTPPTPGQWRLAIYCGHINSTSEMIVDDVATFEVLVQ